MYFVGSHVVSMYSMLTLLPRNIQFSSKTFHSEEYKLTQWTLPQCDNISMEWYKGTWISQKNSQHLPLCRCVLFDILSFQYSYVSYVLRALAISLLWSGWRRQGQAVLTNTWWVEHKETRWQDCSLQKYTRMNSPAHRDKIHSWIDSNGRNMAEDVLQLMFTVWPLDTAAEEPLCFNTRRASALGMFLWNPYACRTAYIERQKVSSPNHNGWKILKDSLINIDPYNWRSPELLLHQKEIIFKTTIVQSRRICEGHFKLDTIWKKMSPKHQILLKPFRSQTHVHAIIWCGFVDGMQVCSQDIILATSHVTKWLQIYTTRRQTYYRIFTSLDL